MDANLTTVFKVSAAWGAVVLIDEADVFLEERSLQFLERNAMVAVFLRQLEWGISLPTVIASLSCLYRYFRGILFLTTNRVGTIDEAFKSRIHMSLYYPPLDKQQTRDIFRLNLAKLREIESQRHSMTGEPPLVVKESEIIDFAGKHYEDNARSTGCWNGRQIRNAFQIASSLAHHNYATSVEVARSRGQQPPAAPILDRSLFEKVQMSTQSFDRHMKDSKGFDDDLPLRSTFYAENKFE